MSDMGAAAYYDDQERINDGMCRHARRAAGLSSELAEDQECSCDCPIYLTTCPWSEGNKRDEQRMR